jgi:dolichol-phosphate mannosyltransferase
LTETQQTTRGVSIILPTLNEAGNIEGLIQACARYVRDVTLEIIVVDDNSADRTWEIAEKVMVPDVCLRVIRRMENPGLTNSLREGIAAARHDFIVWMDCDFSHPPERIPQMLYMIDQGFDVAVNSRYTVGGGEDRISKGGPLQLFLSRTLNWSIRFLLYPSFSDYTSGFVAVRKNVLEAIPLSGDYGEYFVDFIYRALKRKYKVCELPYFAAPRHSGESKTGTTLLQYVRRGRKYLWTVVRLRWDSLSGRI